MLGLRIIYDSIGYPGFQYSVQGRSISRAEIGALDALSQAKETADDLACAEVRSKQRRSSSSNH